MAFKGDLLVYMTHISYSKTLTGGLFSDLKGVVIGITLFLMAGPLYAQDFSVGVAPYSFKFWGAVDGASAITVDYRMSFINLPGLMEPPVIGAHYFYQWDKTVYNSSVAGSVTKTTTTAISLTPLNLKYFHLGGIAATDGFPVSKTPKINFYLQAILPVWRFELRYTHISSGFGLLYDLNPGFDTLSLHLRF